MNLTLSGLILRKRLLQNMKFHMLQVKNMLQGPLFHQIINYKTMVLPMHLLISNLILLVHITVFKSTLDMMKLDYISFEYLNRRDNRSLW